MKPPLCPVCGKRMQVYSLNARSDLPEPQTRYYVAHRCHYTNRVRVACAEFLGPLRVTPAKAIYSARRLVRTQVTKCFADYQPNPTP